jgi:hypothetical protein
VSLGLNELPTGLIENITKNRALRARHFDLVSYNGVTSIAHVLHIVGDKLMLAPTGTSYRILAFRVIAFDFTLLDGYHSNLTGRPPMWVGGAAPGRPLFDLFEKPLRRLSEPIVQFAVRRLIEPFETNAFGSGALAGIDRVKARYAGSDAPSIALFRPRSSAIN